jgi:hypothetical protein
MPNDKSVKPSYKKEAVESPKQLRFLKLYNDPKSKTFGNAAGSARAAGFGKNYSRAITYKMPGWLQEAKERRIKMLVKAEKVLEDTLTMNTKVNIFSGAQIIDTRKDSGLEKIKQDSAKFIAERVGKDYYSTRSELTGKEGGPVEIRKLENELREWANK